MEWLWSLVSALGLTAKVGKLVFLGLDDAGKTALLHVLREGRAIATSPTLHPTSEELRVGNITFTTYDLGGHRQARRVWQSYFPAVDAVVFVVDASARGRFDEVRQELASLLADEQIGNVPVLILGNKIDLPSAASHAELHASLGLYALTTGSGKVSRKTLTTRPLELFMCSVHRKTGYGDGFRWLAQYL
jgi:GTP-binding protein SAR1